MSDFYNKYPYTDFHELNLDWVIERVKKLTEDWLATHEEWVGVQQDWADTEQAWIDFKAYVENYLANLDVQDEIDHKINEMIVSGEFETIIRPAVVSQTTAATEAWLAAHITQPTTPVVDTSLTIAGAAADAKVTGEYCTAFTERNREYGLVDFMPNMPNATVTQNVSFTPINKNKYNVNGTAANNANYNLYDSSNALPDWCSIGNTYFIRCTGTNVSLQVLVYNPSIRTIATAKESDGLVSFTIPAGTVGLRIRLFVWGGTTVSNETISVDLRNNYSIPELTGMINTNSANIAANTTDISENTSDLDTLINRFNAESEKDYAINNIYQLWNPFTAVYNRYMKSDGTVVYSTNFLYNIIPVDAGFTYNFATPDPTQTTGVTIGTATYVTLINADDTYYDTDPNAHTNVGSITIPAGVNRMAVSIGKVRLYNDDYSVIKSGTPTNTTANPWASRFKNISQEVNGSRINVSCIGDSLTAGAGGGGTTYPDVLASNNSDLKVNTFAFPSEASFYIAHAVGGMRVYADPFTIPASEYLINAPTIILKQDNGNTLLMDHVATDSLCMIAGVIGELIYDGSVNKFRRISPGAAITLTRPEPVYQCFEMKHTGDISIIWAGTNDITINSVNDPTFYYIDNIINLLPHKKYLVVGLMADHLFTNLDNILTYFRRNYGSHFVNIRQYLLDYGLSDAGITPTAQDTTDIANGTIPTSLRSDATHLNAAGYTVVGNYLYKVINENGWLE